MKNPQDELVWRGRTHIGDEPGVYGDASYSGLAMELPVTLFAFDPAGDKEHIAFTIEAEDVQVFAGYPGHSVTVFAYEPDPAGGPYVWKQVTLTSASLKSNSLKVAIASLKGHKYISFQIRVDTTVKAGLYNDFVVTRLSLDSDTHYAVLGFE